MATSWRADPQAGAPRRSCGPARRPPAPRSLPGAPADWRQRDETPGRVLPPPSPERPRGCRPCHRTCRASGCRMMVSATVSADAGMARLRAVRRAKLRVLLSRNRVARRQEQRLSKHLAGLLGVEDLRGRGGGLSAVPTMRLERSRHDARLARSRASPPGCRSFDSAGVPGAPRPVRTARGWPRGCCSSGRPAGTWRLRHKRQRSSADRAPTTAGSSGSDARHGRAADAAVAGIRFRGCLFGSGRRLGSPPPRWAGPHATASTSTMGRWSSP